MVQNTRYSNSAGKGKTSVNYAADRAYGNSGGFQFGSTAKMFAIATALKQGMPIKSTVNAAAVGHGVLQERLLRRLQARTAVAGRQRRAGLGRPGDASPR